jgi:DNA polymerase III alpha subunit
VIFVENNNLPYDHILKDLVEDYASVSKYEKVNTQSVFYKNKEDFKAYLTFRCINNRSTLEKPQLNNMSSDTFCFENWGKALNE